MIGCVNENESMRESVRDGEAGNTLPAPLLFLRLVIFFAYIGILKLLRSIKLQLDIEKDSKLCLSGLIPCVRGVRESQVMGT